MELQKTARKRNLPRKRRKQISPCHNPKKTRKMGKKGGERIGTDGGKAKGQRGARRGEHDGEGPSGQLPKPS